MGIAPYFAILVTAAAGYLMIKKVQTQMLLFTVGFVMISVAILCGQTNILPKGVASSGFIWFDMVDLLRIISMKQSSGIGLIIMAAGGFSAYMTQIGASDALVKVCLIPLRKFRHPYIVLALGYCVGAMLYLVIPSAAGLAMLLLVAMFPVLVKVGVSKPAAAAVIATCSGMSLGPASGVSILAAKTSGLEPIVYFVQYQIPIALPSLILIAVLHIFVQRYFDRKGGEESQELAEVQGEMKEGPV